MVDEEILKAQSKLFQNVCSEHQVKPLFCVLSGSHSYGYDTPASDYDLRGVYVANPNDLFGFGLRDDTIELKDGDKLDMVLFEVSKFAKLLAKPTLNMLDLSLNERFCLFGEKEKQPFGDLSRKLVCRNLVPQIDGIVHNCKKEGKPRFRFLAFQFLRGAVMLESGSFFTNLGDIFNWGFLRHHDGITDASLLFAKLIGGALEVTDALYMSAEKLWEEAKENSWIIPQIPPPETYTVAEELACRCHAQYYDELLHEKL